jgi:DNA-binding HxlR family transcriptional regulator
LRDDLKSGCPINLTLEVLGDRWSLLIIRDMMFGDRRHYRELLAQSVEGISSNILAERLKMLLDQGIITKADDPTHKQKAIYSLTEQGISLVPILAHMGAWGVRFLPVREDLAIRAELLAEGGPEMWEAVMDELRERHLGVRTMPSVHRAPTPRPTPAPRTCSKSPRAATFLPDALQQPVGAVPRQNGLRAAVGAARRSGRSGYRIAERRGKPLLGDEVLTRIRYR